MAKKQNIVKKDSVKKVRPENETKAEKLKRIKSEVSKGTYRVDSKDLAKVIIKKTKESSKK